jgi:uncharacterized protein YciI
MAATRHFLLLYDVVPEYLERRGQYRSAHLALARAARDRGELVLGGALADPADTVVLLFKSETPEVARAFAEADPYVLNGLVKSWRVREWTTVVGDGASTPVAP